jgi:hypothetical protein
MPDPGLFAWISWGLLVLIVVGIPVLVLRVILRAGRGQTRSSDSAKDKGLQ